MKNVLEKFTNVLFNTGSKSSNDQKFGKLNRQTRRLMNKK